jgi:hypothetical protein
VTEKLLFPTNKETSENIYMTFISVLWVTVILGGRGDRERGVGEREGREV